MNKVNTTFLLSGGAGRIITAIPALEAFHKHNPDDDFKVLIYGWDNLFYSHPILQNRTYDANMKGMFELLIKNNHLVVPEPYHHYGYYNQHYSLAESFDRIINSSYEIIESDKPNLYLHSNEDSTAEEMIAQAKHRFKKDKFIVFQPYGSGINSDRYDSSGRSLYKEGYEYISKHLSKDAVVLYFGNLEHNHINDENIVLTAKDIPGSDLRFFMSMIKNCDYFVGVDSVGQHMARAFDIPGTVLMGSTFEINVTYPWFQTYRKEDSQPTYNPIRISPNGTELIDRLNDGIMNFSKEELKTICDIIDEGIEGG